MPELPEVETTRRALEKELVDCEFNKIIIRQHQLRWPIPNELNKLLPKQVIRSIDRRGKYLLINVDTGCLIIHLGMSGHLHILPEPLTPQKHDHADFIFTNNVCLRYNDPRRFGTILWNEQPDQHRLIKNLGVEPLTKNLNTKLLYSFTQKSQQPIKPLIMDSKKIVGIGNIYACEALFKAGIHPARLAKTLTKTECQKLVCAIKTVLKKAIKAGGTTLKDFYNADGKPGYFRQQLQVYGHENKACNQCGELIEKIVMGGRSTFYCRHCQH